jgi:starch phosphorylase
MNEGHSAFMALERCRELVSEGLSFDQASEVVKTSTVFTVHTPVAAGNDAFSFELINQCFGGYWGSLGLRQQDFHQLGSADHGWGPVFSMPALALRFSSGRNGVAELHGETSRRIWSDLWPEVPVDEVPIGHVTNGVHAATWVAPEIQELLTTVMPEGWRSRLDEVDLWEGIDTLEDERLWQVRRSLKSRSIRFLRRRVKKQLERQEANPTQMHDTDHLFDADALTLGFARRFATYKRATLIFSDLERLATLLNREEMPVQLVFAGKAHPADQPGQALITKIHNLSKEERFAGKILFVEDYDMAVGRALTRGVDVWLNNPRRPLEASGTSGQKAAMNGVLNLSVLDGWWPEGFNGSNGWAIGADYDYGDEVRADEADADALYDLLEREVVPLYYQRDEAGIPSEWVRRVKIAIKTISPRYNAQRMVKDYVRRYYAPASVRGKIFAQSDYQVAKELTKWRKKIDDEWPEIYFSAKPLEEQLHRVGDKIQIEAVLHPRGFSQSELRVELVYTLEEDALGRGLHTVEMKHVRSYPDGGKLYRALFKPEISGRLVYGLRVFPWNDHLASPFDANAIRWA